MALGCGTRLGAYEILTLLGSGGMGEVYRARDTKLGRDVALKILPDTFTHDAQRLARFRREAQVLASLNHPHIGAIYGVDDANEQQFLVLELVDGESLARRIARGPIPVAEVLAIARQIAEALEAAHEKGIIHRDLKPANIALTKDGDVKVLDFGLAKATEGAGGTSADVTESPTITSPAMMTNLGMILGTAAYMSPEQARGQQVDRRSDVWAFGCIVCEMLTARQAFGGDTMSDTIAAILQRDPPLDRLPTDTPAVVLRLLRHCLEKDPRRRLHDIADARIEIDDVPVAVTGSRPVARITWGRAVSGVLAVALLAVVAGWIGQRRSEPLSNPLANAEFTRLTDFEGAEHDAAISSDGKFVSFVSDRDGLFDVWVSQIGSGRFTNLTTGKFQNLIGLIPAAGFSGDWTDVWVHDADIKQPLWFIPMLGGPPRVFLSKSPAKMPPMNVAWSPDGSRLVYHTADDGDPIFVADRTGANPRQIFIDRPGIHNHFPVWSPDGRWIYFVRGDPSAAEQDVWRIQADGGDPQQLTHHNTFVAYPAPIDRRTVVYIAKDRDGSGPWLWAVDVDRKLTHRVSFGLEQYISVAASADGRRLAASVANPTANLWSVPILNRPAEERDVTSFPVPSVRALAPRFGGRTLFYLSSRGTLDGLWRLQEGQGIEVWKGSQAALYEPAAISVDGRRVAVVLRKNGTQRLHVLDANGGDLQDVGGSLDVIGSASWSPDGTWVAVGGNDGHGSGLFKIPVDGGSPVRLASGAAINPVWAPDGSLIAYAGPDVGAYASLLAVTPDGMAVPMPTVNLRRGGARVRFMPDSKSLVYMTGLRFAQDFWMLDLRTAKTRPLTHLTNTATMQTFDITPDGKQIIFDRLRENSDIVLIDLPGRTGH